MERCAWCDKEYDPDDFIDDGVPEPECKKCETVFCAAGCLAEHDEDCDNDGH